MLSSLLVWICLGLIVGVVARLIYPDPLAITLRMTSLFGVVGALLGGLFSLVFVGAPQGTFEGASWIISTIGAALVVWSAERANQSSVESM